jgi:D-serine deaminase-like pyridoxal phosphate-dependent protein
MMVAAAVDGEPCSRLRSVTVLVQDLRTPALLVDAGAFERNRATMTAALPGDRLRPHVKAFKSTALARELAAAGHRTFCGATLRELHGLVAAGLGADLLLANETVDEAHLREVVASGGRITIAVDSDETIAVAARAGGREVLIDVNVGMPRCGCRPEDAGPLAQRARQAGLEVRGVMGYEGHLMTADPASKAGLVAAAMEILRAAHADAGGEVVSGGGTGTYAINRWCTEIQAGSYLLMDSHYGASEVPFEQALHLLATVVSVDRTGGWAVADGGLKALGMDHGDPSIDGSKVWFCSDEHTTFAPLEGAPLPRVGDRVRIVPAHVDPTVAYHERLHVVSGDEVVDAWPVDLRGW